MLKFELHQLTHKATVMAKAPKQFRHSILTDTNSKKTAAILQAVLTTSVDLALLLKQAHWNVVGANFRSVHLQLDEIWDDVQDAVDEIAERIVTLGISVDGRSRTIASKTELAEYPAGFVEVENTISKVADAIALVSDNLTKAIESLDEADPISQDLLVGIAMTLQKHLWMIQAQDTRR